MSVAGKEMMGRELAKFADTFKPREDDWNSSNEDQSDIDDSGSAGPEVCLESADGDADAAITNDAFNPMSNLNVPQAE